ncbi:MAG: hypothetical protein QOE73_2462 [Verrucomicrobiota bacterium]
MANTRATITGGVGAILIAVVVGAITHSLDRYNWEQQHKTERLEYREVQAEKVFDSVTASISRFTAAAVAVGIYSQAEPVRVRDSLVKVLMTRMQEFEVQLPIAAAKVKLYFSDSTYKTFDRTRFLMSRVYCEAVDNLPKRPPERDEIKALVAFDKHMTELATMMESELANGITKK